MLRSLPLVALLLTGCLPAASVGGPTANLDLDAGTMTDLSRVDSFSTMQDLLAVTGNADLAQAHGDMSVVCQPLQSTSASGHHNPGKDCKGCHGDFTIAGTLYSTATGGAAVAGATIEVVDAAGVTTSIVTAQNGNFWAFNQVAFPIRVRGSSCPTIAEMKATSNDGYCNGCHGSTMRIHVP